MTFFLQMIFYLLRNLERELLARIDFLLYKMKLMVPADSLVIGDMVLNMEKYELAGSRTDRHTYFQGV